MKVAIAASLGILALACAHTASSGGDSSEADRLIGTWGLVEMVHLRPDGGTTTSEFGAGPRGTIVYDRSGHMAAQISYDSRPTFHDPNGPTPEEGFAAFDSYLAYAGTYTYDPTRHIVTHHVEISLNPSIVGQNLSREVQMSGDRIVLLTPPGKVKNGEQVRYQLTWSRLSGP